MLNIQNAFQVIARVVFHQNYVQSANRHIILNNILVLINTSSWLKPITSAELKFSACDDFAAGNIVAIISLMIFPDFRRDIY